MTRFLTGIAQRLRGLSEQEVGLLKQLKARHEGNDDPVMAWDRAYYTGACEVGGKRLWEPVCSWVQ